MSCGSFVYSDGVNAGNVLAPGQKWRNYDTGAVLEFEKVNKVNFTIAGTYDITIEPPTSRFPFRGEFDPKGITVGFIVSYWNDYIDDHALGVWAGYVKIEPQSRQYVLSMSGMIAHENNQNTTSGYDTFVLESN